MRRSPILPALLLTALLAVPPAHAQDSDEPAAPAGGQSIAIYQNDLALVTTRRPVALQPGTATLSIDGISPSIVAGSLDIAAPGLALIEQSVAPWPLDRRALLQAYLGQEVTLVRPAEGAAEPERVTATVLSIENGLVLRVGDAIEIDPEGRIVFPELPDSLSGSPRANVRVQVEDAGARTLELRYLTRGLSWQADYVARYDEASGQLHLTGLAQLTNDLPVAIGADALQLVAGQVSLPQGKSQPRPQQMRAMAESADANVPAPQTVSDLKVYEIGQRVDLPAGGSVQLPLLQADGIAVQRDYRLTGLATAYPFNGERGPSAAQVRLHVPDTQAAGLDQPLPAGSLRVYADTLYRGAEEIGDVPVGGELTVDLGRAFDVTGTARQTAFEQLGERAYESAQEIVVRNAKEEAVTVQVLGDFPPDWEMRSESHPHDTRDATTPVWTLEVPAGGETTLTYRVRVRR